MRSKPIPTKSDIVVFTLAVVMLLMCLGAMGSSGRRRAKEAVCLANLFKWGVVFQEHTEGNNGQFYPGLNAYGYWWPAQLDDEVKDWTTNRIWFCPEADQPYIDESGNRTTNPTTFTAWGIYKRDFVGGEHGFCGSYGLNGYVIPIESKYYEGGVPASAGWRTVNTPQANDVPLFVDALRFDLWPRESDSPASNEFAAWSGNHMARTAINRHNGGVNSLFLDFSARKVGLKEMWTLKWHRDFQTDGPWTLAGGVQPEDWPEWMQDFKDY